MWTHRYTTWGLIGLLLVVLALWMRSEYDGAGGSSGFVQMTRHAPNGGRHSTGSELGANQRKHGGKAPSGTKMGSLEQLRETGMFAPAGAPNFTLVDSGGIVSRQALEWAGVDLGQTRAIQRIVSGLWARETARMQSQVIPDPDKPGNCYLIESVPGHGDRVLGELEQDFADIVGKEAAGKLMLCLQGALHFGWFGKFDLEFELVNGPGGVNIRFQCRWPETGDRRGGGSGLPKADGVRSMFGPGFRFESLK